MADLNDNEIDCLRSLDSYRQDALRFGWTDWCAPIDIGGRDGSHHSGTLRKLAIKGLVERRFRGAERAQTPDEIMAPARGSRGSCVYRITQFGRSEIDAP